MLNVQIEPWIGQLGQLTQLQQQALDYLQIQGLPTRHDERWKYADFSQLLNCTQVNISQAQPDNLLAQLIQQTGIDADWRARVQPEQFRDGIDALHYLLAPQTLHIKVQGKCQLQLNELNAQTKSASTTGLLQSYSICIELEDYAELELLESYPAQETAVFLQLQLMLGTYAQCQHGFISPNVHIGQLRVLQQQHSLYRGISLAAGSQLCRREHQFDLTASQAKVQCNTLSLSRDHQHHDMRLEANHQAADTLCDLRHTAVADQQAVSNCNGRIHITPQGHQAEGAFLSKTLLLSSEARVNTQPELEIYHDQVRCSHGASTCALDEDQRLYLRTRGLDEQSANKLLLEGFLRDAFERFANPKLSDPLWDKVLAHLHRGNDEPASI